MIRSIRSGGETGVDRAALDVALRCGIAYAGWCPKGGWAEDFTQPPGLLAVYPPLSETPSSDPRQRTEWNVRDSDATLVLRHAAVRSAGTDFATRSATVLRRTCLVLDVVNARAAREAAEWLARLGPGLVLNVAGPRESEAPGIYAAARRFLCEVLK